MTLDPPRSWLRIVNEPQTEGELAVLRQAVRRGSPFGTPTWTARTVPEGHTMVAQRFRPGRAVWHPPWPPDTMRPARLRAVPESPMHPDLWTVPGINFHIRTYGFVMFVGFLVAVFIGWARARRARCEPGIVTNMALIGVVLGFIGCRGMFVLHMMWQAVRSGDVGVKEAVAMGGGGEILGGVILAILGIIVYLAVIRKPIRLYLDIGVAPMILAMGIGRIGCLMFGCCFGGVCETESGDKALPWTLRFPYGSPAYTDQWERGQLTCPSDLMWVSPLTNRPEPVPREVFDNATVSGNETLAEWAMIGHNIHALKEDDPASPDLPGLEKQWQALRQTLAAAGKKAPTKIDAALAMHLARLSAARADGKRMTLADLRVLAAGYPSKYVHPTQLYDAIALGLMFVVLSVVFYRRRRYGMVVAWTMLLYPVHRFVQEMIRVDNPRDVFGLTISQFLCLVVFALGVLFVLALIRFAPKENLPDGVQV